VGREDAAVAHPRQRPGRQHTALDLDSAGRVVPGLQPQGWQYRHRQEAVSVLLEVTYLETWDWIQPWLELGEYLMAEQLGRIHEIVVGDVPARRPPVDTGGKSAPRRTKRRTQSPSGARSRPSRAASPRRSSRPGAATSRAKNDRRADGDRRRWARPRSGSSSTMTVCVRPQWCTRLAVHPTRMRIDTPVRLAAAGSGENPRLEQAPRPRRGRSLAPRSDLAP
jgi:hypothetical protein